MSKRIGYVGIPDDVAEDDVIPMDYYETMNRQPGPEYYGREKRAVTPQSRVSYREVMFRCYQAVLKAMGKEEE